MTFHPMNLTFHLAEVITILEYGGLRITTLIKSNKPLKMITNISRQLTTGALAIASSVAAFGFAGAAPAQAQAACPTFQSLSAFLSLTSGCTDQDKLYKGDSTNTTNTTAFLGGQIAISNSPSMNPGEDVHRLTYTRGSALSSQVGNTFTLAYTISILPSSTNMFNQVSLGVDVAGQLPGITTQKFVSAVKFGDDEIGNGLLISANGGTPAPVTVPDGVKTLYIIDKVKVTAQTAQFNAFTNTYTQKNNSIGIPEPSAILGILAVAGAGAFARRKS